jgi:hypothetical protein
MKAVVSRVAAARPSAVAVIEVDISTNADLEQRYGQEIPVLLLDGRKVAKYRVNEAALRRLVTLAPGSPSSSSPATSR